eukprot:TRINITY_DN1491_c0_g1_i2.p1 TRINITY_DN1491_c0_g1~~TRINITY_DN1491_c0_g1_i2.p1  ORF type:complete len:145 (+),score=49.05 TRINITY_DN1491_c0_g1_i2:347-781(+)
MSSSSNSNIKLIGKGSTSPRIAAAPTSPSLCYLMDNVPRLPRSSSTFVKYSLDDDEDEDGDEGIVAPISSSTAPITGTDHIHVIKATLNNDNDDDDDGDDDDDDGLICGDVEDGDIPCSYFESSTLMIPPIAKTASSSSLNPTA